MLGALGSGDPVIFPFGESRINQSLLLIVVGETTKNQTFFRVQNFQKCDDFAILNDNLILF